jgi:hypothetical protein
MVTTDADARAYDAVATNARVADIVALGRAVLGEMARARRAGFAEDRLVGLADELKLSRGEADTPFGNALDVLQRGPEDEAERALARAIAAHALLGGAVESDAERLSSDILWLAAHTPFDATELIDHVSGQAAGPLWSAIADQVQRMDAGEGPVLGRGEALVAAAALAASNNREVAARAGMLATEVRDAKLARVLGAPAAHVEDEGAESLRGEMGPAPRGPLLTIVLALSGILVATYAARLFGRFAFAYRKPAEVSIAGDGGIRVRWRTELLGRTLREREMLVPRVSLARATREVRYPGLLLYAGLLALSVGSYLGVVAFVDGVRAASPSLLGTGLAVTCLGLAIDFALSSIAPSAGGKCRLLFVSRDGRTLCVGGIETARADALLARLSRR